MEDPVTPETAQPPIENVTDAVNVLGVLGGRVVRSYRQAQSMGGDSELLARDIQNLERALTACAPFAARETHDD